jgi:hypothetical protein
MKFKKTLLAIALAGIFASSASSGNFGFETGTTADWTSSTLTTVGTTTINAGSTNWAINPYGTTMGQLQIQNGSYSSMATALGLTSASTTAIQTMLNTQAQTAGGSPTPTTAGWTTQQVTLTAGTQFTMAWQYISVDYVPFNDGSIATLTQTGTNTATVNNYQQQYALLGFTNPGTGDYSTGSYGATGWQVATFDVSVSGTYTLGFGVFNMGDTALSPILFIDEVQGTTSKDGVTFGAVAPNNATAPAAPTVTPTPTPPTTPSLTATVGSGTTAATDTLASAVTVNGGTIQVATTGVTLTNTFTVDSNGMTIDQNGNTGTFSGIISGTGAVTIANTATGGGVTFSAVNTYTGGTIITTGAALTNAGTIGNVTNAGGFTNTAGATAGAITNNSVAVNSGTTGTVTNNGTFGNNASGTTGTVTNNGTFLNNGTTGNVTNNANATFNNNASGTTGDVVNSGSFTNEGVAGFINNLSVFANSGTTGQVANEGTFTNSGSTSDVVNSGTFNNSGTAGPVTNNGIFNLTGNGTVTSIVNNGTIQAPAVFNATGAGSTVNVSSYSQNVFGSTYINGNQQIVVSGTASLAGDLNISNAPSTYGKYTYLTAGTVDGAYNTLTLSPDLYPLGYGLVYSGTDVKLEVTPSSAYTMNSINQTADNLSNINTLKMANLGGGLNYDCSMFGENGMCISTGSRFTTDGAGKIQSGSLTIGKKIDKHWRAGVFADKSFGNLVMGNVTDSSNPLVGAFANWNADGDGEGWTVSVAAATASSKVSVNREGSLYSESAQGKTTTSGNAYQIKTSYTQPLTNRTNISPYVGIRQTNFTTNGYTETGAQYPITYNGITQNKTDLLAGVNVSHDFDDKWSGFVSAGVITNLVNKQGTLSGTSNIIGLQTVSANLTNPGGTTPVIGAGVSYDITPTQVLGLSLGYQQQAGIKSGAVTYTIGF